MEKRGSNTRYSPTRLAVPSFIRSSSLPPAPPRPLFPPSLLALHHTTPNHHQQLKHTRTAIDLLDQGHPLGRLLAALRHVHVYVGSERECVRARACARRARQ